MRAAPDMNDSVETAGIALANCLTNVLASL